MAKTNDTAAQPEQPDPTDAAPVATASSASQESITLDTPIQRGGQTLTEITVRKPAAGELRGQNLVDLLQMDVTALTKVLPRITLPAITEHEVSQMDPADLVQLGGAVSRFLASKAAREAYPTA